MLGPARGNLQFSVAPSVRVRVLVQAAEFKLEYSDHS